MYDICSSEFSSIMFLLVKPAQVYTVTTKFYLSYDLKSSDDEKLVQKVFTP